MRVGPLVWQLGLPDIMLQYNFRDGVMGGFWVWLHLLGKYIVIRISGSGGIVGWLLWSEMSRVWSFVAGAFGCPTFVGVRASRAAGALTFSNRTGSSLRIT